MRITHLKGTQLYQIVQLISNQYQGPIFFFYHKNYLFKISSNPLIKSLVSNFISISIPALAPIAISETLRPVLSSLLSFCSL